MARPSLQDVQTLANTDFADNNVGAITPQKLREWCTKLLEAIRPAYGVLYRQTNPQALTLATGVYQAATFETSLLSDIVDYGVNPVTGEITRLEKGVTRLSFTADIIATGNQTRVLTFALYKNGVITDWRMSIDTSANGEVESVAMNVITEDATAAVYKIMVAANGAVSITLSNMILVAETVPVWNY